METSGGATLSLSAQDLTEMPHSVRENGAATVKSLDVSFNAFTSLAWLEDFPLLESLVADSNALVSQQPNLPRRDKLTTLCVNDNQIDDLDLFVGQLSRAFPNLTYLSMLKNPACPNFFTGRDQDDYRRYRLFVINKLPSLKFLDSTPVTKDELAEAKRVGHLMKVAKPESSLLPRADAVGGQQQQEQQQKDDDVEESDDDELAPKKGKATMGVCKYQYYGKQSEGNRFITNSEL